MAIRRPSKQVDERLRHILANNVRFRMNDLFAEKGDKPKALADSAGVSKSRVQVILAGEQGVSVDVLSRIAQGLCCEPYELLVPPEHLHRLAIPAARSDRPRSFEKPALDFYVIKPSV